MSPTLACSLFTWTVVELPPVLVATSGKVKGELVTDLSWTGTRKTVDLYLDYSRLLTVMGREAETMVRIDHGSVLRDALAPLA